MIKQNSVRGVHSMSFPVIHGDPIRVKFRRRVRRSGIKRGRFPLQNFLNQTVKLRRRGLIKPRMIPELENADGL
jgi:hypothetical protein